MVKITVSNDNYAALLNAEVGEEVQIGHIGGGGVNRVVVKLTKVANAPSPVKMTVDQIEAALGYPVEIVSEKDTHIVVVEDHTRRGFFK